ncbi:hypothetical protein [Sphingomonas sp. UYP23]
MTHYTYPELLLAALVVVIVLAAIAKANPRTPRVRAKALLTERERAARGIIERVLPHTRVHVQVSMGALLQPKGGFGRNEAIRTGSAPWGGVGTPILGQAKDDQAASAGRLMRGLSLNAPIVSSVM